MREILVPLDTSALAEAALPHASALASAFDARIRLLSVVDSQQPRPDVVDSVQWRLTRDERKAYLERTAAALGKAGIEVVWETAAGTPAEQILAAERRHRADLVVLTSHGCGGMSEFPLSGTAAKVLSVAQVSVLVVRPGADGGPAAAATYGRVLAPVDCTPRGDWGVYLAARVARTHGAELLLVSVVESPPLLGGSQQGTEQARLALRLTELNQRVAEEHLGELAAHLSAPSLQVRTRVVESNDTARALQSIAAAEECSLVVLSAHGRSPGAGWPYGSVSRGLLEHCDRPVLVFQDACCSASGEGFEEACLRHSP